MPSQEACSPWTYSSLALEEFGEIPDLLPAAADDDTGDLAVSPPEDPPEDHAALPPEPTGTAAPTTLQTADLQTAELPSSEQPTAPLDMSESLLQNLADLKIGAHAQIEQLAGFLGSTIATALEALACDPTAHPAPRDLPQVIALMQQQAGTQAPITLKANRRVCQDLATVFQSSKQPPPTLEVADEPEFRNGRVAMSWAGGQASWNPDETLHEITAILRQYGLVPSLQQPGETSSLTSAKGPPNAE